jgi:hypothetical protein
MTVIVSFASGVGLTVGVVGLLSLSRSAPQAKKHEPAQPTFDYARPWRAGAMPNSLYDAA